MNKSQLSWFETISWCKSNPNKKALIITREGNFEIEFKLAQKDEINISYARFDEWIKDFFLKPEKKVTK